MKACLSCLTLGVIALFAAPAPAADQKVPDLLNRKMNSLQGKEVDLAKYQGKVLLIVNVASYCGATKQYEQLEDLHEKYKDQGLAVMGFPCNQFGAQEPGTSADIADFCKKTYDVQFDMFEKVAVNDDEKQNITATPLFQELKAESAKLGKDSAGKVGWNFEKFVVGRDGKVVARFRTGIKPDDPEVVKVLEAELAKPAK